MRATFLGLIFSLLGAVCSMGQNPCTTPGIPRNLTGVWGPQAGQPGFQNLYLVQDDKGVISGAFAGVIPFHESQNGTFKGGSLNGDQFTATLDVTEPQLDAAGKPTGKFVTGTGTVKMTLSTDGNTLSGIYDETFMAPGGQPIHQMPSLTWPRQSGSAVLAPATISFLSTPGGDPAMWRQNDNVPFGQSRNVPLTPSRWEGAGRTTTDDAGRA